MEKLRFLHLSWNNIQTLSEKLAVKIRVSNYAPDVIVAVSRGGFDPARILCDQLGIRRLASVQLEAYDGMVKRPEPVVVIPVNAELHSKRTLLVDDVSDSGASLVVGKKHLLEKQAKEVRIATLHVKPWSNFRPDYYVNEVDRWIVYPWELKECLLEVAEKIRAEGYVESAVAEKLIDSGFKKRDVKKYLSD